MNYRVIKQILFVIISLLCAFTAFADSPGSAYQYDLYAQNGKYYYKSIPYYNFSQTSFGKTIVFESGTDRKLYEIDNYIPQQAFLSNNGKSIVTTAYWMWGHSGFEDQPLIEFYFNGKPSKKYFVDDLISNKDMLQFTSSHTLWYEAMCMHNDTLFIVTLDDQTVLIDVNNADIIGRKGKGFFTDRFNKSKLPELKSIVHDTIKYPDVWQFPDLSNGTKFKTALMKGLNKVEVEKYDSCIFYIQLYGTIDRKGSCEIFMLSTSNNRVEDPAWTKQVEQWVRKQKYKTDLIPVNCDKWVFSEFFYLR